MLNLFGCGPDHLSPRSSHWACLRLHQCNPLNRRLEHMALGGTFAEHVLPSQRVPLESTDQAHVAFRNSPVACFFFFAVVSTTGRNAGGVRTFAADATPRALQLAIVSLPGQSESSIPRMSVKPSPAESSDVSTLGSMAPSE